MKIVAGLIFMGLGVWCVVDNRRLAEWKADGRWPKLLSRGASVRVNRVITVVCGLWLLVGGAALIVNGWKEFK